MRKNASSFVTNPMSSKFSKRKLISHGLSDDMNPKPIVNIHKAIDESVADRLVLEELAGYQGRRSTKNGILQGLEITQRFSYVKTPNNERKIEAFRSQRNLSTLNLAQGLDQDGIEERRLRFKSYN